MSGVRRIVRGPDLLQSLNNAGQSVAADDTWHTNKHSTHTWMSHVNYHMNYTGMD